MPTIMVQKSNKLSPIAWLQFSIVCGATLVAVTAMMQGCAQRNLFTDNKVPQSLQYFEGDSAVQTRETRQNSKGAFGGFGYPSGPGTQ